MARFKALAGHGLAGAIALACIMGSGSANAAATPVLRGVNISGGEFAGGGAPGTLGTNYTYPTKAEIDYYASLGLTILRIPFMWERLQPALNGALAPVDRQKLRDVVTYATGRGMTVVLDMHNYARRAVGTGYSRVVLIGSAEVPAAALSNAWIKIAGDYKTNARVWIGLMNEPYGMTAGQWWPVAQKVVNDLRAASIPNKIMVPGVSWTGAHSWVSSGNASQAQVFKDPRNNYAFEVHQYLDADSSGTSDQCVVGAGARVATAISWAKTRNVQLFMGEMASAGTTARCRAEYRDMLGRMESSGRFIGWTAWGGGTWWVPNYPFRTLTTAFPVVSQRTAHLSLLLERVGK
jgi:endoglucanase